MGWLRRLAENEDGLVELTYLSFGGFVLVSVLASGVAHRINRMWLQVRRCPRRLRGVVVVAQAVRPFAAR